MPREQFSKVIEWIEDENPPIEEIDAEIEKRATTVLVLPPAEMEIAADCAEADCFCEAGLISL
jgi:hypothetical protein